ncbi:GNAT family N-acetyltransferase [Pseudonocardia sp.]|uniref:GNAT family N-acetyltransferase n=1 Tax=Pseudonocardia sp. TaxID=60912 RepID=UPI003D1170B7
MEPVEINAGTWYLRALRADERIDDRPAVLASALEPDIVRYRRRPDPTLEAAGAYVAQRAAAWERDERFTWAVCEPTTGEMVGEVDLSRLDLDRGLAEIGVWALPPARGRGLAVAAVSSVLRFGFGGLGLHRVTYMWAAGNTASEAVARRCGFVPEGLLRGAWMIDGAHVDMHVASRLATDR